MPMRELEIVELASIFHHVGLWRGLDAGSADRFALDAMLQLWQSGGDATGSAPMLPDRPTLTFIASS